MIEAISSVPISPLCALLSALCALLSALCALRSALYSLLSALCSLLSALCSLLAALCSLLSALCSLRSALCSLLSARCSLLAALCSLRSALCALLAALCSLLAARCSLLAARCPLLTDPVVSTPARNPPVHKRFFLMRFIGGVCQSTAPKSRTAKTANTTWTAGIRPFIRPSLDILRHVALRHAHEQKTRSSPRIPHAISIDRSWSDGEGDASAEFEKPTTGSSSPSAKLQPLLELYFVACLMERTWRFCLPVVLAKAGGAVR